MQALLSYKEKEANFRRVVQGAHRLFCDCGDPRTHLQIWPTTPPGGAQDGTGGPCGDGASTGDGGGIGDPATPEGAGDR